MKSYLTAFLFIACFSNINAQHSKPFDIPKYYAEFMGYSVDNNTIILPDKSEVKVRDFYLGTAGKEYSYCYKKGLKIKVKKVINNGFYRKFPVCYDGENEKSLLQTIFDDGEYGSLFIGAPGDPPPPEEDTIYDPPICDPVYLYPPLPTSYCVSEDINLNSPASQGSSGMCYAYAAVACADEVYERATGDDVMLSAASVAFCGKDCYPGIILGYDGLDTDFVEYAMRMCCEPGIASESVFPTNNVPNSTCIEPTGNQIRYIFNSYGMIPSQNFTEIAWKVKNTGPVSAAIVKDFYIRDYPGLSGYPATDGKTYYINDMGCNYTELSVESMHAVAIVGWGISSDQNVGLYWIVKNSWDGWGYDITGTTPGGQYGFIKATSNIISCLVSYVEYNNRIINKVIGPCNAYSLGGVPYSASSIEWSMSNSSLYYNYSGTSSVATLSLIDSDCQEWDDITFTINYDATSCSSAYEEEYVEQIWVGRPINIPSMSGPTEIMSGETEMFDIPTDTDWTTEQIDWDVTGPFEIVSGENQANCYIRATNYGIGEVTAKRINCNGTTSISKTVEGMYWPMAASPNPTSTELTIDPNFDYEGDIDIKFDLINEKGERKKVKSSKGERITMTVSDLPNGTYYLNAKLKWKESKLYKKTLKIIILK